MCCAGISPGHFIKILGPILWMAQTRNVSVTQWRELKMQKWSGGHLSLTQTQMARAEGSLQNKEPWNFCIVECVCNWRELKMQKWCGGHLSLMQTWTARAEWSFQNKEPWNFCVVECVCNWRELKMQKWCGGCLSLTQTQMAQVEWSLQNVAIWLVHHDKEQQHVSFISFFSLSFIYLTLYHGHIYIP